MPTQSFHAKPFDEGTLTKLDIFALYAREWLPVFLSRESPTWPAVHVFDFFAGPGGDSTGREGSPLRLLSELSRVQGLPGWRKTSVHLHLFDADSAQVDALKIAITPWQKRMPDLKVDLRCIAFHEALGQYDYVLSDEKAAKLLFIDQFGVDEVTGDVFLRLVRFPRSDFLFFLSSSTLHRFADHPYIKQKIVRPEDPYHVHRAAFSYYQDLPRDHGDCFLVPFSIKKGANIYGLIFGSKHPRGMDKFLEVAWKKDQINGEANFDINRDDLHPDQLRLPGFDSPPTKIVAFEYDLETRLRAGKIKSELDVISACFDHGVTRGHAKPVLSRLKQQGVIAADFRVPDIRKVRSPRPVRMVPENLASR